MKEKKCSFIAGGMYIGSFTMEIHLGVPQNIKIAQITQPHDF
jgi:hypothetical protein